MGVTSHRFRPQQSAQKKTKSKMTKTINLNDTGVVKKVAPEREARWEKYLSNYEVKNPVKFASKKANGEFDTIPASFL